MLPIGFGTILVNIPISGLMDEGGLLRLLYDYGIMTELFPCLAFLAIGAMIDFGPLLNNPKILLLGAAAQFGIFITIILALLFGFSLHEAICIGIIGACDGPTAIYMTTLLAPHLLAPVTVAAYSYMSLVPIIQPPIMRALTTKEERRIKMEYTSKPVAKNVKILFPMAVTLVTCLIAPKATPLMGMLMLGNLMRESGVVERLAKSAENEICNIVTLFLGIAIGATMSVEIFLTVATLQVYVLGLLAIALDTASGIMFGKLMCQLTGGKVNPLIGACGISAYPMSARAVHMEGRKEDPFNFLLMHAVGSNTGGQIGSIMAAGVILSFLPIL